jgi:hypothetical protein
MARITAESIAGHLEMSGFVVMRRAARGDFAGRRNNRKMAISGSALIGRRGSLHRNKNAAHASREAYAELLRRMSPRR